MLTGESGHKGSVLLLPEATAAVVRRMGRDRRRADPILRLLGRHLREFDLLSLDDAQVDLAVALIRRHGLRGADGVHLAAALSLARDLGRGAFRFASADDEQLRGARAEGLRVSDLSG